MDKSGYNKNYKEVFKAMTKNFMVTYKNLPKEGRDEVIDEWMESINPLVDKLQEEGKITNQEAWFGAVLASLQMTEMSRVRQGKRVRIPTLELMHKIALDLIGYVPNHESDNEMEGYTDLLTFLERQGSFGVGLKKIIIEYLKRYSSYLVENKIAV